MTDEPSSSRRWLSLFGICISAGLVWIAFADFGVAIPKLADEFKADLSVLQWANNAFSLVTGALVIAGGKFGDMFGRRRLLSVGVVTFGVFSIVAALAQGPGMLIVGRGLMGIGAAAILPASLALIPPQFQGRAQLIAFGVWQAVAWGGQAVGPAIGGGIAQGLGWRWLFWLNVPLCAAAFLVVGLLTPESRDPAASRRVDWLGLGTIGVAAFALLYALTDGPAKGWSHPVVLGMLALTVVAAAAWVFIENRSAHPLVDLSLFRLREYDGALIANLMMNLAFAGLTFLTVLWLQKARGYTEVQAGLLMLPSTLGIFAFIPLGSRLDAKYGSRLPALVGMVILSAGLLILGALNKDASLWLLAVGLVVLGLGLGMLSTPLSNAAVGNVPHELSGTAAGVFKMSSMVGGALGIAAMSAVARGITIQRSIKIFEAHGLTEAQIDKARASLPASATFREAIASLPEHLQKSVTDVALTAFSTALGRTMLAAGLTSLVVTVAVALLWPRTKRTAVITPTRSAPPGRSARLPAH